MGTLFRRGTIKAKDLPMKFIKYIKEIGIYNIFEPEADHSWIDNNFDAITNYIFHCNTDFMGKILDVDKCKNKIEEIRREKNKISKDFFSLL